MLALLLNSSADPSKLSGTVSGLILTCSAIVILLAGKLGIVLGAEQVSALASQVGIAAGTLWTLFGLIRKVVMIFKTS
jgi:hypothetical protein